MSALEGTIIPVNETIPTKTLASYRPRNESQVWQTTTNQPLNYMLLVWDKHKQTMVCKPIKDMDINLNS